MSADDFGTRPFVAGSLTGLRAFTVTPTGRLTGIFVKDYSLTTGVNRAEYAATDFGRRMHAFSTAMRHAVGIGSEPSGAAEHELVSLSCRCGFYAYFDGGNDFLAEGPGDGAPRVAAVVEGFGKCVVGGRGFRAEKLRLVALIRPLPPKPPGRLARRRDTFALWLAGHRKSRWAVLFAGSLTLSSAALALTVSAPATLLLGLLTGGAWGVALARLEHHGRRLEAEALLLRVFGALSPRRAVDWDQLLVNYPDVPVYPTTAAALKAHPLTVPEPGPEPTPARFKPGGTIVFPIVRAAAPKDPGAES